MLTALLDKDRIYAGRAIRGPAYSCPDCKRGVILRKGPVRIPHFAHEPGQTCPRGDTETEDHLEAKSRLYDAFLNRSLRVEAEWEVPSLAGDRRADVYIWEMGAGPVAIELQHTPILPESLASRTQAYMAAGVAVIWVPFVDVPEGAGAVIEDYRPKPFELWVSAFGYGEIWYWSSRHAALFRGRLEPALRKPEKHNWERDRRSRKSVPAESVRQMGSMRLTLEGPFDPAIIGLRRFRRKPGRFGQFELPGGAAASFAVHVKVQDPKFAGKMTSTGGPA